jgi:hypothetical protein
LMIKRMGCRMISDTRYLNNFLSQLIRVYLL